MEARPYEKMRICRARRPRRAVENRQHWVLNLRDGENK